MPTKDEPNLDRGVSHKQSSGEISGLFSAPKLGLAILALLTLADSLLPARKVTPGHGATIFLSWALVTRLWLPQPSRILLGVCFITSTVCIGANHGLLSNLRIFHSFYFYLFVALTIVFWERLARNLGLTR